MLGSSKFHSLIVSDKASLPISRDFADFTAFLKLACPILTLLSVVLSANLAQTTSGQIGIGYLIKNDPVNMRNKLDERAKGLVSLVAIVLAFVMAKNVSVAVPAWLGRSSKGSKASGQTANEADPVTVCSNTGH